MGKFTGTFPERKFEPKDGAKEALQPGQLKEGEVGRNSDYLWRRLRKTEGSETNLALFAVLLIDDP